jgi:hypothetical protein
MLIISYYAVYNYSYSAILFAFPAILKITYIL